MSAVFKMESQPILGCTSEAAWKRMFRKQMLIVYAKAPKGTNPPETFNPYQQGLTWTKEMTEWIATHSE